MSNSELVYLECSKISKTFDDAISSLAVQRVSSHDVLSSVAASDVVVDVHAVGLNYFDLLMLVGKYQYSPPLPFSPCTEAAGVVIKVGSDVTKFKKGDRVYFTMASVGASASLVSVSEFQCSHLPKPLSFEQGAGFTVGYRTAYHGLVQRGQLKKGEILLVTGASGGMGLAAIQIGKLIGATVIAAGSDDDKLKVCKDVGADHIVNYKTNNLKDSIAGITNGNFCDVIYENVGGDIFTQCVKCIAGKGRLLVVGFASGKIPSLPANLALVKGFSLVGVRAGAQMAINPELQEEADSQIHEWAEKGLLRPYIGEAHPIENFKQAFESISQRRIVGKCVLTFKKSSSKM